MLSKKITIKNNYVTKMWFDEVNSFFNCIETDSVTILEEKSEEKVNLFMEINNNSPISA